MLNDKSWVNTSAVGFSGVSKIFYIPIYIIGSIYICYARVLSHYGSNAFGVRLLYGSCKVIPVDSADSASG